MTDRDAADELRANELVAAGGSWNGLIFDNPTIGLPPALTWSFTFDFQDVIRDYGDSPISVEVDWVPGLRGHWRDIAPQHVISPRFAEPAEASVYFFEHYRFEAVELQLLQQRGSDLQASATLHGDLDDLGMGQVHVDAWLRFEGIIVALSDVSSAQAARARLADFADDSGLTQTMPTAGGGFRFLPADEPNR